MLPVFKKNYINYVILLTKCADFLIKIFDLIEKQTLKGEYLQNRIFTNKKTKIEYLQINFVSYDAKIKYLQNLITNSNMQRL